MKKISFFNSFSLLVALLSIILTSCLKDKGYENGDYGSVRNTAGKEYVSIPLAANASNIMSLEVKTGVQTVNLFKVIYDYVNPAASDINVTLTVDNNLLKAVDTTVLALPASVYTLPSATATIPAGKNFSGDYALNVNTSTLDPSKRYGIAFTIASVSKSGVIIAQNLKSVVFIFGVKNKYDGIYSVVSGYVQRYTNPTTPENPSTLSGSLAGNADVTLTTMGPNIVEITNLKWGAGSGSGVAGIDNLRATIDPATNLVTMQALGNATLTNWAGKENKYDPATKTFYLAFRWNPTSNVREYEIVLKYKGPR